MSAATAHDAVIGKPHYRMDGVLLAGGAAATVAVEVHGDRALPLL